MKNQILRPTFNAEPQGYEAAVQKMRGLIMEGMREPSEGLLDASYFAALREQIARTPNSQVKKHAFA